MRPYEEIPDATDGEREIFPSGLAAGEGRLLRILFTAEQHRTSLPEREKPKFPEVCIAQAPAHSPTLRDIGAQLIPTQEAVNFCTKTQYAAAAVEPPHEPYPGPKLANEPEVEHDAEFRRTIGADIPRRKPYGLKKRRPTVARLAAARTRAIEASEIAGAWKRFGGLGSQ